MRSTLFVLGLCAGLSADAGQCTVASGPHTAALVELYTSQRCSSCPPADRWLSSLRTRGYAPGQVVPMALHIDAWEYIGWKDSYAQRELSLRQRKLTRLQRLALVFTPQVLLQGRDFRGWGGPAFDEALGQINARPATARIALEIIALERRALRVRAHAELSDPAFNADPVLYLAAYENRLENHVVLEWQGPFAVPGGRFGTERLLPLLPGAVPTNSGVVAFVQDRRTAQVLQALMLPACR